MSEIITIRGWQNNDGKTLEVAIIENEIVVDLGKESFSLPLKNAKELVLELQQLISSIEGGK